MEELERLGMLQLGDADRDVVSGVRVVHAPGHTPGHRCVTVTSGGETLLLAGDLLHVPIQVERPEVPSNHDVDPEAGCRSRLHLLESARHGRWRIAVSHFGRPLGRIESGCWVSGP
jgi:glyoxylase-like metal-dependent hydrolase (beta-lactamase superfamily II)